MSVAGVQPLPSQRASVLHKDLAQSTVRPNLVDYAASRAGFSWEDSRRRELDGLPGGAGLNIAHEAADRHGTGGRGSHIALRWLTKGGECCEITYAQLTQSSNKFANVLRSLGIQSGERVAVLSERRPEIQIAALGTLKRRAVFCPLFAAFGPEPLRARLAIGKVALLVTTESLYRRKVAPIRSALPDLRHVLLIDGYGQDAGADTAPLQPLLDLASGEYTIPPTDAEDMALLHFTSGTTGTPKGAVHVHGAVIAHHLTGKLALDFHADDIFWCTADPGWVTGTSYGIIAPLTNGITSIIDEGDFDAARWYQILQDEKVTVWYTAPTAVRLLMKAGSTLAKSYDLSHLRFIASVGEPLNAEAVLWGMEAFGLPIHDNWWQTETGGIMIANFRAVDIRPGSMGLPLPGIEAAIVRHMTTETAESVELITEPDVEGELAIRPGWPSMFRAYLGDEERYRRCFVGGWYLTGDLARRDADGYFWFVGRSDDVIKSSGHLIGPFEVESTLLEHPAVAEAAVIGKPDPIAGETVKAFVAVKDSVVASDALRLELLGFARSRLGAVVAPKELAFVASIPHTRSGKIMRRLLRARELGLPEGDLSTLEGASS